MDSHHLGINIYQMKIQLTNKSAFERAGHTERNSRPWRIATATQAASLRLRLLRAPPQTAEGPTHCGKLPTMTELAKAAAASPRRNHTSAAAAAAYRPIRPDSPAPPAHRRQQRFNRLRRASTAGAAPEPAAGLLAVPI
jgi:hypothetical protein